MSVVPTTKDVHEDWADVQTIESLIDSIVSNSATRGEVAVAFRQDVHDCFLRAIDIAFYHVREHKDGVR